MAVAENVKKYSTVEKKIKKDLLIKKNGHKAEEGNSFFFCARGETGPKWKPLTLVGPLGDQL